MFSDSKNIEGKQKQRDCQSRKFFLLKQQLKERIYKMKTEADESKVKLEDNYGEFYKYTCSKNI